ncbi:hypothetical protein V757_10250 [Pelistega indica]|uniref:Uncharacterized protein n=1 Tax=Pelistega indica TaxID=1414851 RepID=V8FXA5_9BURK|nr:hypothetical protein V757_10250 [Pelistega indica]
MKKVTRYLLKFLIFFVGFHIIYFSIVYNCPLIYLTNEQGAELNEFLVSMGNPDTAEAYYFVFNTIFISVHAIVSLIILFALYYLFKLIRFLIRRYWK